MKKKVLLISLSLVLVLAILVPTAALAKGIPVPPKPPVAKRFNAVLTPAAIDATIISAAPWPAANPANANVWPIIDLIDGKPTIVGWIVDSRGVHGSISGDFNGAGEFTYGGILDTLQSGSMQGILAIQTGGLNAMYLAASGDIAASVVALYKFEEIVAWCGAAGLPVGIFFSQIYNAPELALLPDGNMTFAELQAWCAAIGVTTGQFLASVGYPPELAELPDEIIATLYGVTLPPLPGLAVLGGMYGDPLPPLPKTLSAEFKGTLRIDAGTGDFSGVRGIGQFGPYNKTPLILNVTPDQHVASVQGAIQLSGTYIKKAPEPRKLDKEKLLEIMKQWKDRIKLPKNG